MFKTNTTSFFSCKQEITYLSIAFFSLFIILPIMATFLLTNLGINQVSKTLVTINPKTKQVEILDPLTKKVLTMITNPMQWPIQGRVTLEFGQNDLPYQPLHTGIDIAARTGTPITPFMHGTVSEVGHLNWGYGNYVVINNGNNITSLYGHMEQTNATVGQLVKIGDTIGYVGQTGWATGPHVHFQININNIPVNPRTFLGNDGP